MQQKKIIFAILSIVYGSTYTMEQNNQTKPEQSIKSADWVKCGSAYLPKKYLNDIVLGNIIPNWQTGQVLVKPGELKEYENRPSSLPGADETRKNAVWLDSFSKERWNKEDSKGKKERHFFVVDSEKTNKMLNEYVALIFQTLEKK